MLTGLEVPPAIEAERVITAGLADLRCEARRGVGADSPSGPSKAMVVRRAANKRAFAGGPLVITAHNSEQVDDLSDGPARNVGAGISELLDVRPSVVPAHLNAPIKFLTGSRANPRSRLADKRTLDERSRREASPRSGLALPEGI